MIQCIFHYMYVFYLKRKKNPKYLSLANYMHAEVFRRKCTDVCNLFWNALKNAVYWWMDRGKDGQIDKHKSRCSRMLTVEPGWWSHKCSPLILSTYLCLKFFKIKWWRKDELVRIVSNDHFLFILTISFLLRNVGW